MSHYMGWGNSIDSDKFIQSNPKKWIGLSYWVDMNFKIKNPLKILSFR
jgi:hypothetical protein